MQKYSKLLQPPNNLDIFLHKNKKSMNKGAHANGGSHPKHDDNRQKKRDDCSPRFYDILKSIT
jgi:hypothetical protein